MEHLRLVGALAVAAVMATCAHAAVAQPAPSGSTASAAIEPVAPPVDTLVAWALARSPEITAARARAAAAERRAGSVSGLTDPMLEVGLENETFDNWTVGESMMSMLAFELRQDLPWPGKRGARRRAAESAARATAIESQAIERQVASEVQSLCASLYAIDRRREILDTARETARLLGSAAASRYAAGTAEMEEQVEAQLVLSRIEERHTDAAAERRQQLVALRRILGDSTGQAPIGRVIVLPEPPPPPADWPQRAAANAVPVRAARAAVEAARADVAAEQSERRPDLFVAAGYGYRGALDPMLLVRVGTGLPIWSGGRQGPRIDAAQQESDASLAALQQTAADTRATAEAWVTEWERADIQVKRYREAIVPQSRLAFEAARTTYESGKGTMSTVIENFGMWLEAQEQQAQREAERFTARARLESLLVPPPPQSTEGERP